MQTFSLIRYFTSFQPIVRLSLTFVVSEDSKALIVLLAIGCEFVYNRLFHIFATDLLSNLENRYQGCNKDFSRRGAHTVSKKGYSQNVMLFLPLVVGCRLTKNLQKRESQAPQQQLVIYWK